ncbi:Prss56 [Acrasis kona]|uniref:Prss56 n=1 Tax=Acrasis kona TaxID=1008807 RepID=A0AAW2ZK16_9EUKA
MILVVLTLIFSLLATNVSCQTSDPSQRDIRIAGGGFANVGEFAHTVGLTTKASRGGFVFCGGALIAPYWVLTAGHCFSTYKANEMAIRVGTVTPQTDMSSGLTINAVQAFVHPLFNNKTLQNDVALIQLAEPVQENNSTIMYMNIESDPIPVNFWLWAAGYGHTENNGGLQKHLKKVQIPTVPGANCLRHGGFYSDQMICAGLGDGRDTCSGDSGTSIVYKKKQTDVRWTGIGITSFGGAKCGGDGVLGTYTKISFHRRWINNQMSPSYFKNPTGDSLNYNWRSASTRVNFGWTSTLLSVLLFVLVSL